MICSCCNFIRKRQCQKLSKLLSKGFNRSDYWIEYTTKNENKNTTNKYRNFPESNFVVVNRLFVLVYANEDGNAKRLEAKKYYLPNYIIKNYNEINNGKKLL